MKKSLVSIVLVVAAIFVVAMYKVSVYKSSFIEATPAAIGEPISIFPKTVYPGDPIMITTGSVDLVARKITFDGKKVPLVLYAKRITGFVPVDFNEKNLEHEVVVTFLNGVVMSKKVHLTPREKIEKPLGIPEKLGGNTQSAAQTLVSNLEKENIILNSVKSSTSQLWKNSFHFPLSSIFVTDDYGYNRATVGETIVHKGTDFRAKEGTSVMAMNDGVVKISRTFIVYGNTIIIDHGKGIQTFYMHLSKRNVKEGDTVKRGEVIGQSGMTGYAEAPHLHISIKINGISIDPMTFMTFFVPLR